MHIVPLGRFKVCKDTYCPIVSSLQSYGKELSARQYSKCEKRSHVVMLSILVFRVIVSESVGDGMHGSCWWQRSGKLTRASKP